MEWDRKSQEMGEKEQQREGARTRHEGRGVVRRGGTKHDRDVHCGESEAKKRRKRHGVGK
jgi:hypothetical protein